MDQDSFRLLLQTPRVGAPPASGPSTGRNGWPTGVQKKTIDASQPAFKPRKVKKSVDSKYRDRAAERRVGEGNDFAEVEAVLEDFNKRTADIDDRSAVEAQRKYLGGDGDHSVLVKGLDVALLEQNRSRATISTEDDDSLEQAFLEATSAAPKKRTREDLIRELKQRRASSGQETIVGDVPRTAEEEARLLQDAKIKGKFKPIGSSNEEKGKKKQAKVEGKDGERKKKKRKVQVGDGDGGSAKKRSDMPPPPLPVAPPESAAPIPPLTPKPDPPAEDFDIFADAGEYEGIDIGDDDDDSGGDGASRAPEQIGNDAVAAKPHAWVPTEESRHPNDAPPPAPALPLPTVNHPKPADDEDEEGELEPDKPMRLAPLASSAVPSIKDLLAMNGGSSGAGKRRKRKGKGNDRADEDKPKKVNLEAKADRDYKRLKSYTDKKEKAGASSVS